MSDDEQAKRTDEIWAVDWKHRILQRIHSLGYSDFATFLAAHPAEPYSKLSKRLGNYVAPIQVIQLQFADAALLGGMRAVAADVLTREISSKLKRGWGHRVHGEFNRAHAFACWISVVQQFAPEANEFCKVVWDELTKMQPPTDWRPLCATDPYILRAFEIGWPN